MSDARNVLLITNIFPPQIGGPATFISRAAHRLAVDHGYRVTVICSSDHASDPADADRPYTIRRLHRRGPIQFALFSRMVLGRELLRHRRILVNGLEQLVYPVARRLRRRYVLKVPGDNVWQGARNAGTTTLDIDAFQTDAESHARFAREIARRNAIACYASHVITPSDYLRRMVIGWGVNEQRVSTITNGVALEQFAAPPPERRPGEPFRVTYVGRLTNWKGVETLLLALVQFPEGHATIAGDGPSLPSLVELARQLGVDDRVNFLGRQSHHAVVELLATSHALVLTSLYEGMSHTLQEALAAGVPCIASHRGGNDEVIDHGHTGLLIEPQNVSALVDGLRRFLHDEPRRRQMGYAARAASAQFSMEKTISAFVRFFNERGDDS